MKALQTQNKTKSMLGAVATTFIGFGLASAEVTASMKRTGPHLGSFVADGSSLQTMLQAPPSIHTQPRQLSFTSPIVDVVSIGSMTRFDYLTAQVETWASHRSTRHFWGFSEVQDFDQECASLLSPSELEEFVTGCQDILRTFEKQDDSFGSFFSNSYGATEGGIRSGDPGWICAQRRLGRTFGWLHSQYAEGVTTVPDYLVIVDDDTYMDMEEVLKLFKSKEDGREGRASGMSGCLFESEEG